MSHSLDSAAAVTAAGAGRFVWSVPDGWSEGRSTWSGVAVAALVRAIGASEPDASRIVRNVTMELLSAIRPGPTEIVIHALRRGSKQSTLRAELTRDGEVLATATAMLAPARRRVIERPLLTPPEILPPDQIATVPAAPGWPELIQRLEFRPATGLPFMGGAQPVNQGWVRFVEPPDRADAALLAALIDAWWPAALAVVTAPYMTVTTTSSTAIACDPQLVDLSQPSMFTARTLFDHEGFQMESRELYDRSGRLLATNQRTFVVLG